MLKPTHYVWTARNQRDPVGKLSQPVANLVMVPVHIGVISQHDFTLISDAGMNSDYKLTCDRLVDIREADRITRITHLDGVTLWPADWALPGSVVETNEYWQVTFAQEIPGLRSRRLCTIKRIKGGGTRQTVGLG